MNANLIRQAFLDFFKSKEHQIVESAPMVVKNDPTLMFTNAGMNQFKDIFLGNRPAEYKRVADSQKCLRVSGKHNDLEEVGHDTYHHTMFEMLGNWSFGNYFKKEAIDWAWEFLVDVLKIDKNRLYATVFEGSPDDKLDFDAEAHGYWKKYLPEERILRGNKKDNFWEMGDTGPCGPCSEIHVDLRNDVECKKIDGKTLVNTSNPLVIEIWNLVFIQFNRKADNSLEQLPAKHVDTGMGFERLCMVVQGKQSNYDTDVFQPIIAEIAKLTNVKYGDNKQSDIAMRVIADHLRTISFAIADGQIPENNKAGYVIRRILRRAVRYGYTFLNQKEPFINKLVPVLVANMGHQYPELKKQQSFIERVMTEEEHSFLRTLENGIKLLDQIMQQLKSSKIVSGKDAFKLYDTFGFPLDLTELILRENNLEVNRIEFDEEMNVQRGRSQEDAHIERADWVVLTEAEGNEFVGYDNLQTDIKILRYRKIKTKGQEVYQLIFDKTPFYAESGGQIGDSGYIQNEHEKIEIIDTQKENTLFIHLVEMLPQHLNAVFHAQVNTENRISTANNHSATHLLQQALREVLGQHCEQKGSLVTPDKLRFDFSHFQKMTDEEIALVETKVNERIRANYPLEEKRSIPMAEAKAMGAMAFFGEKYGDFVRVVKFGSSLELCGGTHVPATGQISMLKIISEGAIAAGIRRIEAVTGKGAEQFINQQLNDFKEIKQLFKNQKDLKSNIESLMKENSELRKLFAKEQVRNLKQSLKNKVQQINGVNVIAEIVEIDSADSVKEIAYQLRDEIENLIFLVGAAIDGKASLTMIISENLVATKKYDASKLLREIAKEVQGGGGGQAFFATAGGKNPDGLQNAMKKALTLI